MPDVVQLQEISFSFWDAALFVLVALFLVSAPRYKKIVKISFKIFLIFIVFAGTQIVAGAVVGPPWDLLAALLMTLIFIFMRNVLIHNVGVALGIAGIASVLGLALSPTAALVILVALSVYDIFSVYVTKHMVVMARNMIESGAPFGFIIPSEGVSFLRPRHEAQARMGEQFMVLGSGDVGLPLILACSLVGLYVFDAVIVALFSFAGLFLTHLIFINQKVKKPMAALPPIATMAIIGYLIASILN